MHVDGERIQRLIHGELGEEERLEVDTHLDSCPECAERLASARAEDAETERLLAHLDHPAPSVRADDIRERAAVQSRVESPSRPSPLRWAAGLALLLAAAGGLWAATGAPLPAWLRSAPDPQVDRQTAAPPPPSSGVALPVDRPVAVEIVDPPAGLVVEVRVDDETDVRVTAPTGRASWTSREGGVQVTVQDADVPLTVSVPRTAAHVSVRLGDRLAFLKAGDAISVAPVPEADGSYRLLAR